LLRHAFRVARIAVGVVVVLAGVAGCFLPIIPGLVLIVLGLGVLSLDIPAVRRMRDLAMKRLREERARLAAKRARRKAKGRVTRDP